MRPLFILCVVLGLSSCAAIQGGVDLATEKGAVALAQGVAAQCSRSLADRIKAYHTYVVEEQKARPGKPTALRPLDCDGDGQPDF